MSINKTIDGTTYRVAELGNSGWGTYTTEMLVALIDASLTKGAADTKPLTAELDLGDTHGVQVAYVKSNTTNAGTTGKIRLANGDIISWRNAGNTDEIEIKVNAGNRLVIDDVVIPSVSSTDTLSNKTIDADSNTISNLEVDNLKAGVLDTDLSDASALTDTTIPSAKATKAALDLKIPTSYLDTDGALAANSDAKIASQKAVKTYVDGHINDTTAAHAGSAIGNTPSGNLAATDVQAALNELQSDIDTRATAQSVTDHLNDTVGAHAASAIASTPSGNLAATEVQAALNELQSDIDTRAPTSTAVTLTGTQVLTNKDIDGGVASDTSRIQLPTATNAAALNSLTDAEGSIAFTNSEKKIYVNDGTDWKVVGGGLIPTNITVSGTTPSIATLESGKQYVYNGAGASGDVTVTMPAVAAESNLRVTVYNIPTGYKLIVARAGSDQFRKDDTLYTTVEFVAVEVEQSSEFVAATSANEWLVNDGSNALGTTWGGALTVTGAFTANGDVSLDGGTFVFNETGADKDFRVESDGNANMIFVDASANRVGIGTSSPSATLNVIGGDVRIDSTSLADGTSSACIVYGAKSGGGTRYGGVGVLKHSGITEACAYLDMSRQSGTEVFLWVDDSGEFRISTTLAHIGTTSGTVVGTQTSDARYKRNILPIGYGLNQVLKLNPVSFDIDDKHKIGFIAQETMEYVPEAVYDSGEDIDGTSNTKLVMDYVQIIPVLVKAMQEQHKQIEELKDEISAMRGV